MLTLGLGLMGTYTPTTVVSPDPQPDPQPVDGVLCERVSIDGQWATIDGKPVYMEV